MIHHLQVSSHILLTQSGLCFIELLKRQSRDQSPVFWGRILIFMANYFPFSERSGLNILSEFNTENITKYMDDDGTEDDVVADDQDYKLFEGMDMNVPGLDEMVSLTKEEKKKNIKVDYSLYVKFWSLQDYFRTPVDCFNKKLWKTFTSVRQLQKRLIFGTDWNYLIMLMFL